MMHFVPQDREALVQALMLIEQGRVYLQKVGHVKALEGDACAAPQGGQRDLTLPQGERTSAA